LAGLEVCVSQRIGGQAPLIGTSAPDKRTLLAIARTSAALRWWSERLARLFPTQFFRAAGPLLSKIIVLGG
jgi:hypothetical protein